MPPSNATRANRVYLGTTRRRNWGCRLLRKHAAQAMTTPKPVVLIILDGWGYRAQREANAIALARTPNYTLFLRQYPWTLVYTSGERVGLPDGLMGNSEVGHLNIGAGRIVCQAITRIDASILRGDFFKHGLLLELTEHGRAHRLHRLGHMIDARAHSH